MKIIAKFQDCYDGYGDKQEPPIPESDRWLAWFEPFPKGMTVTGKTKQEAFDQLMISLRVKILYDSKLNDLKP